MGSLFLDVEGDLHSATDILSFYWLASISLSSVIYMPDRSKSKHQIESD